MITQFLDECISDKKVIRRRDEDLGEGDEEGNIPDPEVPCTREDVITLKELWSGFKKW